MKGNFIVFLISLIITSLYNNPFVYTYFFGDANTKKLVGVYEYALEHQKKAHIDIYLKKNKLNYCFDKVKNQYEVYSPSNADVVYINFKGEKVDSVLFSPD